ncbi:MAG: outer membrane protein assembly factor BamD, partial [Candidatus Latescibacteria bacterium]|nr:outer membrane protein assembly factor BamD [Candidatus Latescibacterota bacterium]
MIKSLIVCLFLFCALPCRTTAAPVPAETLFVRSVEAYRAGQFQKARAGFREILDRYGKSPAASASALMFSKTLYKLQEYDQVIHAATDMKQRFPTTRYLPDVDYLIGNCYYRMGRLLDAAFQYMHVLSVHGGDLRLRRRVLELVGGMSLKVLSKHDLDLLKRRFEDDRTTEAVTLGQAFYLLQGGDTTEGMRR